jgi:hypothetical protein
MADRPGGKRPHAEVRLIYALTEHPIYGAYVRGQLALAGIDLSTPVDVWLDAVYAVWVSAPFEQLEKLRLQMTKQAARIDPDEARKTWGRRPEHVAMAGSLGKGAGVGQSGTGAADAVRRWEQTRGVRAGRRPSMRNPTG